MSNTGKFNDRTPFLRVAGITSSVYGASVDQSLRQDLYYQVIFNFYIIFRNFNKT